MSNIQWKTCGPEPYFYETESTVFCVKDGSIYKWSGARFEEVEFVKYVEPVEDAL